ncbi:MAG: NAD(P)H-hydrate dehydratase [Candidatus Omnitrophica bacterium]|nr:NAD(P)H-hydrate dehydratase [Candidatus Omnitrophota bacterium]
MKIAREFKNILKKRKPDSNKSDYGHVFVLAGSPGLTGAAYLTGQAAILSGSGLVTVGIPESLNCILASKFIEVMTKPLPQTKRKTLSLNAFDEILDFSKKVEVSAIGPGLSQESETQRLIQKLIMTLDKPMVLDADGINALSKNVKILNKRKADMIITPHPGEMARLTKKDTDYIQKNRLKVTKDFARDFGVVCVLKGYKTVVANPDGDCYINYTGNPGMATAGSGDVLTGIIASFIGQGIGIFDSAKLAVHIHGLSGDLAKRKSDLLRYLPFALKPLYY